MILILMMLIALIYLVLIFVAPFGSLWGAWTKAVLGLLFVIGAYMIGSPLGVTAGILCFMAMSASDFNDYKLETRMTK